MSRITKSVRLGLMILLAWALPMAVAAAPFAAYVMDARTGKPIYAQNADTRLHPASLTKMMTLYMAFTAIERGQVRLDSKFLVSSHAASQPPSRLGLKPGQQIELRYLIRAAAVKSANDAATVIGEGLAGSEPKFAAQMTAMARALGMNNSNFRNANGLTVEGHYSTARDMTLLGRRLFYDFPQYYSIFSRRSADAGIATVASTNRRFLDSYEGADGIKTGYTRAAGFNLTASAKRGSKRIIATVLGGSSTAHRNEVMAQLLDAGFGKAPTRVREVKPAAPQYVAEKTVRRTVQVARAAPQPVAPVPAARLAASNRPVARASTVGVVTPAAISAAVSRAQASAPAAPAANSLAASARPVRKPGGASVARANAAPNVLARAPRPEARPEEGDAADPVAAINPPRPTPAPRSDKSAALAAPANAGSPSLFVGSTEAAGPTLSLVASPVPAQRSETIILASLQPEDDIAPQATEIVSRRAGAGGRNWGVSLGLFRSHQEAEQLLLRTALQESGALDSASSRIGNTKRGFEANFVGMTRDAAELACSRIAARQQSCQVIGR